MRIASTLACLLVIALAACSPPQPPEEKRRPKPRAVASVVQAADAYKDSARTAVANAEEAAAKQKAALDAAMQ